MPRCLDAYVMQAYAEAGLGEDDDPAEADIDDDDLDEALAWAEAGVCVLQQSLPWPFTDCLTYSELDNRPAHRVLYAYASLLGRRHPRKAAPWFRAMVYLTARQYGCPIRRSRPRMRLATCPAPGCRIDR